jgi:hypothetical protein
MDQSQPPLCRIEQRLGVSIVCVLRPQLDQTDVEELARAIEPLLAEKPGASGGSGAPRAGAGPKIIIDLAPVEYSPSRLLGVLVTLHTRARNRNGMLRLCSAQKNLIDLFTLTRLAGVLHLDVSVEDALKMMV